ncbi:MAG TPA: vitamin K epoxide reductase family protein [Thermoanaerobaculia bacterium]|nr:vitamin K epoxide reductase family protein [Thermoanaerobaculia bacterium]
MDSSATAPAQPSSGSVSRVDSARRATGSRLLWLAVILALAGALVSLLLLRYQQSHGTASGPLFRLVCGPRHGGCAEALQSRWATLSGRISVAALGVAYFGALALWYAVVGRPNRAGRFWQLAPLTANLCGAIVSLVLMVAMLAELHTVCPWCLVVHAIDWALLAVAFALWPRERDATPEPARPATRLGIAGLLLAAAFALVAIEGTINARLKGALAAARAQVEEVNGDVDLQRYLHLRTAPLEIPIRPDDGIVGGAAAAHTIVVFSDFQCPGCRRFAALFRHELVPMLDGQVRLVFKHFPLDQDCNPIVAGAPHPQACEAAAAAEAARETGGTAAFLRMHDSLFEHQGAVREKRWGELARDAGLVAAEIAARTARRAGRERIAADVALGGKLKLDETPAVFIDGRPLAQWDNPALWRAILAGPAPGSRPRAAHGGRAGP